LERIRNQPFPVLVLSAAFPRLVPPAVGVVIGLGAYNLEKRLRPRMLHPSLGRWLGFRPALYDARSCESPEELADLVIASSSTPPFTPVGRFRGRALLDGGMVDNIPAFAAETAERVRRNIVFLTRPYPRELLTEQADRLYLAPSHAVPIHRWDYTRPDLVDATIEMGEREADTHQPRLESFMAI